MADEQPPNPPDLLKTELHIDTAQMSADDLRELARDLYIALYDAQRQNEALRKAIWMNGPRIPDDAYPRSFRDQ